MPFLSTDSQFRKVLENLPTAVATASFDGDLLFCNSSFIRTFGYALTDIPTISAWAEAAYPDTEYRDEVFTWWNAAVAEATISSGFIDQREVRIRCKDQTVRDVLISATALEDKIVASFADITDIKRTQKALHEARATLEKTAYDITVNLPAGIYSMVQPADGGMAFFSFMSNRFLELTGLDEERARENPLNAFACVHPDDYDDWVRKNAFVFEKKLPFRETCRVVINNEIRWITAESTPRGLPDGATVWEGVLTDVTDRELARQTAEASNRAKTEFVSNVSHEIRTPLNAVLGFAQLLEKETLTDRQHQMVTRMRDAGLFLLSLIDDLLDLAKVEAGSLAIEPDLFSLPDLLADVCSLMEEGAHRKGLSFSVTTEGFPQTPVFGDALRLRQVLLNLVGNAIKFTEQGDINVRAAVNAQHSASMAGSGFQLRIEISDTGIGINPEHLDKLFEPFKQVDGSISRRYGGSGLGLSISRSLLRLMGGTIGAESEIGRGSRFWFEVPLSLSMDKEPRTRYNETGSHGSQKVDLAGKRLLIVDDSLTNRILFEGILTPEKVQLTLVASGAEALHEIEVSNVFDAILLDLQMPHLDGYETSRRIRSLPGGSNVPIIAVSAGATLSHRASAVAAGMDDFLPKPIILEDLLACLGRWVSQESPGIVPSEIDLDPVNAAIGSNQALSHRLMKVFREEFENIPVALHAATSIGDYATAARLMHNLRGAARHIGAFGIADLAEELEGNYQRRTSGRPEAVLELSRRMKALLATMPI